MRSITSKKIIYLDQFAVSNMFYDPDSDWLSIYELIKYLFEKGKIICPLSIEHFTENVGLKIEKAMEIEKNFFEVSGGYCFKPELLIQSQQIISSIRNNNITKRTYLTEITEENLIKDKSQYEKHKDLTKELSENVSRLAQDSNDLVDNYSHMKLEQKDKDDLFNSFIHGNVNDFIERLEHVLKTGQIDLSDFGVNNKYLYWMDPLFYRLFDNHKMTIKEAIKLIAYLGKFGFENFPSLNIRFLLFAYQSINNKKERVNDTIDTSRILTGLPISYIFLTDKQRKKEILDLGLDTLYDTKVFSGQKKDLEMFKVELEKLK